MIKQILKELFTKTYIAIALILCLLVFIITYFYLPELLREGIQKRKEYDKQHHLGWYSYYTIKDFHYNEENFI